MKQFHFLSNLSTLMELYLTTRNEEGYLPDHYGYYLQELDCLSKAMQNESFVTRELVEAWDSAKPYLSNRTKIQRHNTIRKFAAFAFANDGISASLRKRRSATATPMFPARRKSATRSAPMKSIRSQQPLMWTTISALTRRQRGNFRALIIGVLTSVCTQRKIRWRICGQSTIGIPAPSPIGCVPCP